MALAITVGMKQFYLVKEDSQLRRVQKETYVSVMAALRSQNPDVQELSEDKEFSDLHDLLTLMRMGYLQVHSFMDDGDGQYLAVEIGK